MQKFLIAFLGAATVASAAVPAVAAPVFVSTNQASFDAGRPGIATSRFSFAIPTSAALGTNENGSYTLAGVTFKAGNLTGYNDGNFSDNVSYLGTSTYANGNGAYATAPSLTISFAGPVLGLTLGNFISAQTLNYTVNGQAGTFAVPAASSSAFLGFDTGKANSSLTVTFTGLTQELDIIGFQTAVPEAASWAMMMVGLGIVGGSLRRRQRVSARVALA